MQYNTSRIALGGITLTSRFDKETFFKYSNYVVAMNMPVEQ